MRIASMLMMGALLCLAGACDDKAAKTAAMHEGQGEEVTADPNFQIKLKVGDGDESTHSSRLFALYEAKPVKTGETERPQGFEVRGEDFVLAGRVPADLKIAPQQQFAKLVGQTLEASGFGGDPSAPAMSKVTTGAGKTYTIKSGTVKIDKAFFKKGQYAGLSGTFEIMLQELKLGDTDDPNNKGDQPVGEPIKATGSFTSKALAYPYESL